ncbi:MAG TPA: phospho-sugar mutase [Bacilli bacterium]|nr:phospho-sugar mutase [Bacilli bacterium]
MLHDIKKWKNYPRLLTSYRKEMSALSDSRLHESFYRDIDFGTGGMRGEMGAGTNRINDYTIKQATIGLAYYLLEKNPRPINIVIAYDTRTNSKRYAQVAARTLAYYGIYSHVFTNPRPTPQLSFMVRYLHAQAGIVITASHNPPIYNGYKIYDQEGCQFVPLLADIIKEKIRLHGDYFAFELPTYSKAKQAGFIKTLSSKDDVPYISFLNALAIRKNDNKTIKIVYTPLHGTGYAFGAKLLATAGYQVDVVKEQSFPDAMFSTLTSPNPENPKAFILAEALAKQTGATLLLATDPDADRLGVAIKQNENFTYLSGSQLGALMLDYLLKNKPGTNQDVVISTIVTPSLGVNIAKAHGLETILTLTGFKFIGEQIAKLDKVKKFYFGFEESFGYLLSSQVRDKDAFQAMLLAAEMFNYYQQSNISADQALIALYETYGYYQDELMNFDLPGSMGMTTMNNIMNHVRDNPLHVLDGQSIIKYEDYLVQQGQNIDGTIYDLKFPQSDVIKLFISEDSTIVFRPSGTEPKLKVYVSMVDKDEQISKSKLFEVKQAITKIMERFIKP